MVNEGAHNQDEHTNKNYKSNQKNQCLDTDLIKTMGELISEEIEIIKVLNTCKFLKEV